MTTRLRVKWQVVAAIAVILSPMVFAVWTLVPFVSAQPLYELPGGYHGWVLVRYEVPSCPPLPRRGTWQIITISATGRACTSSNQLKNLRWFRYQYVYPDGTRQTIGGIGEDGDGMVRAEAFSDNPPMEWFFVGSESELRQKSSEDPSLPRNRGKMGIP